MYNVQNVERTKHKKKYFLSVNVLSFQTLQIYIKNYRVTKILYIQKKSKIYLKEGILCKNLQNNELQH